MVVIKTARSISLLILSKLPFDAVSDVDLQKDRELKVGPSIFAGGSRHLDRVFKPVSEVLASLEKAIRTCFRTGLAARLPLSNGVG